MFIGGRLGARGERSGEIVPLRQNVCVAVCVPRPRTRKEEAAADDDDGRSAFCIRRPRSQRRRRDMYHVTIPPAVYPRRVALSISLSPSLEVVDRPIQEQLLCQRLGPTGNGWHK